MTSLKRTLDFIKDKPVDRPPFHPIIMQFATKYAKIKYRDFCNDYKSKVYAMVKCADDFSLDWVTVMSDAYAEAEDFGLEIEYPEDSLPKQKGHLINNLSDIKKLKIPKIENSGRMLNRIKEIKEFKRVAGDKYFILGWIEGPMAEYTDLRGLTNTCLDLYDHPNEINNAFDIIIENAKQFIKPQIEAGAHCIGIGDAACSQIGPEMYNKYFFHREKTLIDYIHSLDALAKIHICGNITSILPDIIKTGADIIDIDHMVINMENFIELLKPNQVFSGNSDPVSVIQDGNKDKISNSVTECFEKTKGRGIVSAGCEITIGTSIKNFNSYKDAAFSLST